MIRFEVRGIDELAAKFGRLARQFPAESAAALNRTMRAAEQHELVALESRLDRPTPFTMNAMHLMPANARHVNAKLSVRPLQAKYLQFAVFGGTTDPGIEPGPAAKLNVYGNLPGKRRGLQAIAGRRGFVGRIHGRLGAWLRTRGRLQALAVVKRVRPRARRWPFHEIAHRVIDSRLGRDLRAALGRAWR